MSEERAEVRGTVVDREGHPIGGAIVRVESAGSATELAPIRLERSPR